MRVSNLSEFAVISFVTTLAAMVVVSGQSFDRATLSPAVSCTEFLVPKREVKGQQIGQDDCKLREVVVADDSWPEVATVLGLDQTNKYKNAAILREKGLWPKFRMYEVRGISHSGGESMPNQKRDDQEILPMWRLMEGFVDLLDAWVDKGDDPPPTKSDWMELGDADKDGVNENEAIAAPELACPLGVYYPFPPSRGRDGGGTTAWVPFDGKGEEPFDGRFERGDGPPHLALTPYVDMNRSGFRDFRETVTQAWRRLGLLKPTENLTRARYVECTQSAVARLRKDRFISEKVGAHYVERAGTGTWPEWVR